MSELLSKEVLAEIFLRIDHFLRIDQGYHMTLRNQIFEDVLKLRDHCRALEALLESATAEGVRVTTRLREVEAERDRLHRALESVQDCTPDMWSCSMAEQTLKGASFEDALTASRKYDVEGNVPTNQIRAEAVEAFRQRCVEAVRAQRENFVPVNTVLEIIATLPATESADKEVG